MNRRELLKATASLPLLSVAGQSSAMVAMDWPTHTISMIVPFPAGGQADLAARPIAHALEQILGKSVIVDNRGGGTCRARWLYVADDAVVAGGAARGRSSFRPSGGL